MAKTLIKITHVTGVFSVVVAITWIIAAAWLAQDISDKSLTITFTGIFGVLYTFVLGVKIGRRYPLSRSIHEQDISSPHQRIS